MGSQIKKKAPNPEEKLQRLERVLCWCPEKTEDQMEAISG